MSTKVRLAHSSHGAGNAPASLGIEAGCFAAAGIDLAMIEVANTSDAMGLVSAGGAEFAIAAGAPILFAAARGADPLIVLSIEGHNIFAVVGAVGMTAERLPQSTIAVTGPHDQDTLIIRRALLEWGIDPDRDVRLIHVADRGAAWDAVVGGEAAAMAATAPQPVLARSLGLPVLRDFAATPRRLEPYQLGSVATTRSLADRHPALVRDFASAFLASAALFSEDFDCALPHLQARSKLSDIAVLRATHRVFARQLARPAPSVDALAAVHRDIEAVTGTRLAVDVAALVDASFVTPKGLRAEDD
jgi:ABC-type nitrate/sulfonate/bicarbonate transport system substrate-binding protein